MHKFMHSTPIKIRAFEYWILFYFSKSSVMYFSLYSVVLGTNFYRPAPGNITFNEWLQISLCNAFKTTNFLPWFTYNALQLADND